MSPQPKRTLFFETCLGVFQGGGCRAAAFAGALSEVSARGVNFSGVAGTSAGSIVAALIAGGGTDSQIASLLADLDFKNFLTPPAPIPNAISKSLRFGSLLLTAVKPEAGVVIRKYGLYSSMDIEVWVNDRLKQFVGQVDNESVLFRHLPMPLWVVSTDLLSGDVKVWSQSNTPDDSVAHAVRCSCSIPGFYQPVDEKYVDGGLLSNLPSFVFADGNGVGVYARRILAFNLASNDKNRLDSTPNFAKALLNTSIDGATKLQARLASGVHEIKINTGSIRATDFETMDKDKVSQLVSNGKDAAAKFFNNEVENYKSQATSPICEGDDEVFAILTQTLISRSVKQVIICANDARWMYAIFPTLLSWRMSNVEIRAYLRPSDHTDHEEYRRRLVEALGISLIQVDRLPFRGFLIDHGHDDKGLAIIYQENAVASRTIAMRYESPRDTAVIRALGQVISSVTSALQRNLTTPSPTSAIAPPTMPRIAAIPEAEVIDKLRFHVPQYANSIINAETVKISSLMSLSKLVRGYKFQQIRKLIQLMESANLQLFETAAVFYDTLRHTIITPPVVEESDGKYFLIQGTTRALYMHRRDHTLLRCLVVKEPNGGLPAEQKVPISSVLVGDRTISTIDRYEQNIDKEYRPIEKATHNPPDTL